MIESFQIILNPQLTSCVKTFKIIRQIKPSFPLNGTGVIGKPGGDDAAFEGCAALGVEVLQTTGREEEDIRKEDAGYDGGFSFCLFFTLFFVADVFDDYPGLF